MAPNLFKFSAPNSVKVVDLRAPKDAAALALAWQTVALSANYKLFKPTNVPAQLIAQRPIYDGPGSGYMPGGTESETDYYLQGQQLPALVIIEDKSSDATMLPAPNPTGNPADSVKENDGRRTLVLDREGTRIFLQADLRLLTKDQLIDLAATMALVPPP